MPRRLDHRRRNFCRCDPRGDAMVAQHHFSLAVPNNAVLVRARCPTRGRIGFCISRFTKAFGLICSAPGITSWLPSFAYLFRGIGVGFSVPGIILTATHSNLYTASRACRLILFGVAWRRTKHGTNSSRCPMSSHQSACEIGPTQVDTNDRWYNTA